MITRPADALQSMLDGNARFVVGEPLHPHQDVERRAQLATSQTPSVAIFGCSDSRLTAEIIFDLGLGDAFVIRNAGQVVSDSVLGSLEYAVAVLHVPLILVLGHDACGAVAAAIDTYSQTSQSLPEHVAALIAPIQAAVATIAQESARVDPADVGREHLRNTIAEIIDSSELIRNAVEEGTVAVVGANYQLAEGRVTPDRVAGLERNH